MLLGVSFRFGFGFDAGVFCSPFRGPRYGPHMRLRAGLADLTFGPAAPKNKKNGVVEATGEGSLVTSSVVRHFSGLQAGPQKVPTEEREK
jgi:hypothetical protein